MFQVQRPIPVAPPIYLSQIQSSKLASQAQEVFAAVQRKATSPPPPPITKAYQPQPVASITQAIARPIPQPVVQRQPPQYVREQPQARYIQRTSPPQYRTPEAQQQLSDKYEEEKDDYDVSILILLLYFLFFITLDQVKHSQSSFYIKL